MISNFHRFYFLGIVLDCAVPAMAQEQQDTTSRFNQVQQLNEVVVSSRSAKQRLNNVQIGQEKIQLSDLVKVPSLLGERDIFKSLQLLPGIKAESEASSGFQVRGGTSAQNAVLLDNTTIYQAGHLMGMFSSFNDEALTNAVLSKGMIPAQYGDATSSVLTVSTKSGDMNDYHFGGSLGLLSAKVFAEGPLVKDKASFLVTARRSYADLFLKLSHDYKNSSLYFYDINAKIDWQANAKDRLSLAIFNGKDVMAVQNLSHINWMNTSLNLRWMHSYSDKLLSKTSLYYSNYKSFMEIDGFGLDFDENGFIRHYGLNHTLQWFPMENLQWNMGLQSALIHLRSADWNVGNTHQNEERKAWENAIWMNGIWSPCSQLSFSSGLRLNLFTVLGGSPYYELDADGNILSTHFSSSGKFVKTYTTLEPRLSVNYKLTSSQSLKLGYTLSTQQIRAVRTSSWSMPFDRYTMSSNIIKPEMAQQVSLGYTRLLQHGAYDFSLEGYYKDVDHVYDYRDGKSFNSEIEIERLLLEGRSHAYGVELGLHKNTGRFTGWLSYTLSWVENKIDGINDGRWYTANNDRRHDLSVVAMYKLTDKWDLSASWKYNSGQALTAPSAKYKINDEYVYYYSERNGYRSPSYHRLDLGANYTVKKAKYTSTWSFSIYNAYNRRNPFIVGFENDSRTASGIQAYQFSLFGIIPSVAYSIKF
jgi:hypothetical protein